MPVSRKRRQQTADRIQNVDYVQNVNCRLQSGFKMQTENLKSFFVWYVITCHLTTYLFRDQPSRLFALLWNIPGPYLDENRSLYNFKPSCSLLREDFARELVGMISVQILPDFFVDENADRDQTFSLDLIYFRR